MIGVFDYKIFACLLQCVYVSFSIIDPYLRNYILRLALSMYVLEETGSAAVFAGILSVATVPAILLSPLGGILADRADRRNIMEALDALTGICVTGAAVLLSGENAIAVIGLLLVALSILGVSGRILFPVISLQSSSTRAKSICMPSFPKSF